MGIIPEEDQEVIDGLQRTVQELYDQEEQAAQEKNEKLRKACHDETQKILKFVKSIVEEHIERQNP